MSTLLKNNHYAFYISNEINKRNLIAQIITGKIIEGLALLKVAVFSESAMDGFIDNEERHGQYQVISDGNKKSLLKYSDGEKKKVFLQYLINQKSDCIILDNLFDNLDIESQTTIVKTIENLSKSRIVIQFVNRKSDVLPFIEKVYTWDENKWILESKQEKKEIVNLFTGTIPPAYSNYEVENDVLVRFHKVSIAYEGTPVVKDICWEIKKNEFWQMIGPNGSGKSTLLSLIYGDNPKAYGQDITLFGIKKGGGESVRDFKKKVGYFSSELIRGFERYESVEKMLLSGFFDTIGLYKQPSKYQIEIAHQWLRVLRMFDIRKKSFKTLSLGQKRLILIARAMVKQPPLLILDEPTAGLDDQAVLLFTALINKISNETETSILYVSHRKEQGLEPKKIFKLIPTQKGSVGEISTEF